MDIKYFWKNKYILFQKNYSKNNEKESSKS